MKDDIEDRDRSCVWVGVEKVIIYNAIIILAKMISDRFCLLKTLQNSVFF